MQILKLLIYLGNSKFHYRLYREEKVWTLENSILNRKYEINHNELGWRAGDLIILVENGKTTEAMEHILKNHGDNNVISVSTKITPSTGA